jgi:hypothetical protein
MVSGCRRLREAAPEPPPFNGGRGAEDAQSEASIGAGPAGITRDLTTVAIP